MKMQQLMVLDLDFLISIEIILEEMKSILFVLLIQKILKLDKVGQHQLHLH